MSVLSDLCRLNGPSMNINTSQLYSILRQNLLQEGNDCHKLDSLQLFKNQFSRWDPAKPDGEASKVLACLREDNWGVLNLLHAPNPLIGYMLMSLINLIFKKANSSPLTSQYWAQDRTLIASNPSFHKFIGHVLTEGSSNLPTLRKVFRLLNSSLPFFGSHSSFILWCFDLVCCLGGKLFHHQDTKMGEGPSTPSSSCFIDGSLSTSTLNEVQCCFIVLILQFINQNLFDNQRNQKFIPVVKNFILALRMCQTLPSQSLLTDFLAVLPGGLEDIFGLFVTHDDLLIALCSELLTLYHHAR